MSAAPTMPLIGPPIQSHVRFEAPAGNSTWTPPANLDPDGIVYVTAAASGGGGGGGGKGAATAGGGGGSSGQTVYLLPFPAALFNQTLSLYVGVGVSGGIGSATDTTNGTNGTDGESTTIFDGAEYLLNLTSGEKGTGGNAVSGDGGTRSPYNSRYVISDGGSSTPNSQATSGESVPFGATGGGGGGGQDGAATYAAGLGGFRETVSTTTYADDFGVGGNGGNSSLAGNGGDGQDGQGPGAGGGGGGAVLNDGGTIKAGDGGDSPDGSLVIYYPIK